MQAFFEETKLIRAYDVDFNDHLKINSIFNFLQDTASIHADNLKVGYENLIALNLAWVLSWAKLEIKQYPKFGDIIKIKTWPKCKYKFYSMRDFILYDNKGNIFCNATTAWIPINVKSKRITDLKNLQVEIPYQTNIHAIDEYPRKINSEAEKKLVLNKKVKYSDIDLNQHLNNSRYIELVLDSYSKEYHSTHKVESIMVTFISESIYNDELEITITPKSEVNDFDLIDAFNKTNSKHIFQASIKWQ